MKTNYILLVVLAFTIFSCKDDDPPPIQEVLGAERGAVMRNVFYNNVDFTLGDLQSQFNVEVEEQDLEDGGLFESVDLYLGFSDRTFTTTDLSKGEVLFKTIPAADFEDGPNGLPRTTLNFTFQEALEATGLSENEVVCRDQFNLRLSLNLTDGRSFSTENGSSSILTDDCFFKSPYRYVINVVEPLEPQAFTGLYVYSSIIDGPNGPIFGASGPIVLSQGHSVNTRTAPLGALGFEFSIACTNVYVTPYQSLNGICEDSQANILFGPSPATGMVNPDDDGVFEVDFLHGFEGWAGFTGAGDTPVRIRFSKQ